MLFFVKFIQEHHACVVSLVCLSLSQTRQPFVYKLRLSILAISFVLAPFQQLLCILLAFLAELQVMHIVPQHVCGACTHVYITHTLKMNYEMLFFIFSPNCFCFAACI